MNKFLLVIIVLLSLISCGKKGDPEYKGSLDRAIIENKIIKTS